MAERRLRRAVPSEAECEGEGNRVVELLYLSAKLREVSNSPSKQRNDGGAKLRATPTLAAAAARVCEG